MKTFAILILSVNLFAWASASALSISHHAHSETAEFECDPTVGGAFPHETDCEKYYVCASGVAKLFTCQDEMLFDTVYSGCNYAQLTNCGDRIRPPGYASTIRPITTKNPGVTPDPDFDCPRPGGAFAHPEFCELYYVCVDDVPTLHICDGDFLFDEVYDGCNFPELTDCGDRIRPNGTATAKPKTTRDPSVTGDDAFECPSPGGAFEHPTKCEYYYVCVDNVASLELCDQNMLFDTVWSGCNFEELVDCGVRERPPGSGTNKPTEPTKPPGTGPTTTPGPEFKCPEPTGYFPDPFDCSAFYQCDNYQASHNLCSPGLLFNTIPNVCDFPANVDCGDRPIPGKH